MFNWEGCPTRLYDMYIEVGEVKESPVKSEKCVFIELWVSTVFKNDCHRPECKSTVRRPIYGVLKQIKKLCNNKPTCIIIMCDDVCGNERDDTIASGVVLSLLLQELNKENILKHSMLYTKKSADQIKQIMQTRKWRKQCEKEAFISLFELLDAVVFEQANCYSQKEHAQIQSKTIELPSLLSNYVRLTKNYCTI